MAALIHPGHEASATELVELLDAAVSAAVGRVCRHAGRTPFEIGVDADAEATWGVRAATLPTTVPVGGLPTPPLGPGHWWSRTLVVRIRSAEEESVASLAVPWLLNERARAEPAVARQLGAAEGLYLGVVRVPSILVGLRPGLHRLRARSVDRDPNPDAMVLEDWDAAAVAGSAPRRLDAVLVPDLGDIVPISLGAHRGKRFGRSAERVAAALDGRDPGRLLLPSTAAEVARLLDLAADRADSDEEMADLLERWLVGDADVPADLADAPVRATDREGTRFRFWGHSVAYALHRGARRAERQLGRLDASGLDPATVAHTLRWALGNAVRQLASGHDTFAGMHRAVDVTSTLSRVESYRHVSFYGPGGLPEVRNRLDLRDLNEGWRGVLCPLQTPESTRVGLVRYLAAGEGGDQVGEWGDLSISACLVPFIDCDDAAKSSTGAKNLKQAVGVVGAGPPRVRTGWEHRVAELAGVGRSPVAGQVGEVTDFDAVVHAGRRAHRVTFGPGWSPAAGPERAWRDADASVDVAAGDPVTVAPDVRLEGPERDAVLCAGVDALVAMTPWHGVNHEDGIVVSESFARRLASRARVVVRERYDPATDDEVSYLPALLGDGPRVVAGEGVVAITPLGGGKARVLAAPEDGTVAGVRCVGGRVELAVDVDRPLRIGDKLTNRHGGKGVVCAIVPDDRMPRLRSSDGEVVDVVLNPLGVLRRLNVGQLWEMHYGLDARLRGVESVLVGRRPEGVQALRARLGKHGAADGRLPLYLASGERVGDGDGVVVGDQYLYKLDHLAVDKIRARGMDAPRSPRTLQPSRQVTWRGGRRGAPAQRVGEMELWALTALDLPALLADVVDVRGRVGAAPEPAGVKPTLQAVAAHLGVAGLTLSAVVDGATVEAVHGVDPSAVQRLEVTARFPKVKDADEQFLRDLVAGRRVEDPREHPLHDRRHGRTQAERSRLRWAIRLPFPVPHPWDTADAELPPVEAVPIMPPELRPFGLDRLDARYADLAAALLTPPADGRAAYEDRVGKLVEAILGRSTWVDGLVRRGVSRSADGRPDLPEAHDLPGTDEWRTALRARPGGTRARTPMAFDPEPTIAFRLRDKSGLLRRSLLGHAVQSSARAVLVGDPHRDPQTVGVPEAIHRVLFAEATGEEFDDVVIVNRQPTLRPNALLALRAEPVAGDAVVLSPVVLECLAGDFDGDTVAVHRPVSDAARAQAWGHLRPAVQLRNHGASQAWLAKLDLDVALGLLIASSTAPRRRALNENLARRCADAGAMPPEVIGALDSAGIGRFVAAAAELDGDAFAAVLSAALVCGAEAATGWSIGALELAGLDPAPDVAGVLAQRTPAARRLAQLVRVKAVDEAVLTQLLVARGPVDTGRGPAATGQPDGDQRAIGGRYLEGLDPTDAYLAARGGILKLATKKLVTPLAGDLTKQLAEVGYEVAVDAPDCGTPGPRDPLHCLREAPYLCEACVGDHAPRAGAAVGVLAAMTVGQRSTQLALKANRASSSSPELEQIAAVFGTGGLTWPAAIPRERREQITRARLEAAQARSGGRRLSATRVRDLVLRPVQLSELVAGIGGPGPELAAAVAPALAVFVDLVGSSVAPFWAQVLLRQLWAAAAAAPRARATALTQRAMYAGKGELAAATVRGNLDRLVEGAGRAGAESRRTALLTGAWT